MTLSSLDRRKFLLLTSCGAAALSMNTTAHGGKFRNAVITFVERNYDSSLEDVSDDILEDIAERVLPVENKLQNAPDELKEHINETWGDSDTSSDQRHTEKCPYCISVAKEIERRAPVLKPVENKTPRFFVINSAPYVSSNWGSLHRYFGGVTGPAEGSIWFSNGQYVGRAYNGVTLHAQPAG